MSLQAALNAAQAALVTYDAKAAAYVALVTQNPPATQQAKDDALAEAGVALETLLATQGPIDEEFGLLGPGGQAQARPASKIDKTILMKLVRKHGEFVRERNKSGSCPPPE